MRVLALSSFISLGLSLAWAPGPLWAGEPAFSNQTAASGLISITDPLYELGITCCIQLGGGAVGDFDNDGWQDLFHPTGGGSPDKLFINNGDGTFTDRAAEWGVAALHRGTAAAVADFDGDGWLDLYVTSFGPPEENQPGHHRLYRNVRGERFVDVAVEMGVHRTVDSDGDGFGAAWGDYDLDGDLDLAVAGFKVELEGNRLYRNDGDSFTDVTDEAGLDLVGVKGYTPRFVDMDGDRYPELIWIGDSQTAKYYVNLRDGTFFDFTVGSGTALDNTEMGMSVADFNRDGLLDFYVTTVWTNNLYINQGGHVFVNEGESAGVEYTLIGWGTVAVDFDHDRWVDLVATTQDGRQYAFRNASNDGQPLVFEEMAIELGIDTLISGRGLINFDYDNDGDQDLVFFPNVGAIELYRNDLSGSDTNWLRVFLDQGCSDSVAEDGIGSLVKLRLGSERRVGRIDGGSNYVSQSELSAHFGLGDAEVVDELRIEWTDGAVTTLETLEANQTVTIVAEDLCSYCSSTVNSSGVAGELIAVGNPTLPDGDLSFEATGLPPSTTAYLFASQRPDFEPAYGGTEGNLCLADPWRRIGGAVQTSPEGTLSIPLDLGQVPARPGEVWRFQVWFEDANPEPTRNSTNAAAVAFRGPA